MDESDKKIEWPSNRIPQGGIFHPAKIKYSQDTQNLIKLLMEEARLTMLQRNKINYHLRNGDPLPLTAVKKRSPTNDDEKMHAYQIIMKVRERRRKTQQDIEATGAYEKQKYQPPKNMKESSDKAKLRLQQLMSGIKEFPDIDKVKIENHHKHKRDEKNNNLDPKTEIMNEIYERAEWLSEMEELGEGKKHRIIIQDQIAEKLRQLKQIEIDEKELTQLINLQNQIKKQYSK